MMDAEVNQKFESYPPKIRPLLLKIRQSILDVAKQEKLGEIQETLKWGEPSYLAKQGSTLRMDWKAKTPGKIYVYFHCKTMLIETIRELHGDLFEYEGNRAIVFDVAEKIPYAELKQCISLSLRYHSIKHLPLLGV